MIIIIEGAKIWGFKTNEIIVFFIRDRLDYIILWSCALRSYRIYPIVLYLLYSFITRASRNQIDEIMELCTMIGRC